MRVSNDQLNTWTSAGPTQSSINAHQSVRKAVAAGSLRSSHPVDVFLQGSYKNSTNIRSDSDVDIVVLDQNVFYSNLSEGDKVRLGIGPADYTWTQYDEDITALLVDYYGRDIVNVGKKAIRIDFRSSGYAPADVVVAMEYRHYFADDSYASGIAFFNRQTKSLIHNFPKQHYENGTQKSDRTSGLFKSIVRAAKQARNYAVNHGLLHDGTAPSYFIECLLYNLRDGLFGPDVRMSLRALSSLALAPFTLRFCQNEISPLFGDLDTCWSVQASTAFGNALSMVVGT